MPEGVKTTAVTNDRARLGSGVYHAEPIVSEWDVPFRFILKAACFVALARLRVRPWPVLLAFMLLGNFTPVAWSQQQYCAQRISSTGLPTGTACFNTLAEAEAHLRAEPNPPVGNSYMEQVDTESLGLNRVLFRYRVRPKPFESFYGDWYMMWPNIGGGVDCGNRIPLTTTVKYGCVDEIAAVNRLLSGFNYGGLTSGGFAGDYGGRPPQFRESTPVDPSTGRSHVILTFDGVQSTRRALILNALGGLL
ncbi:MAG: hypothetical protein HC793_00110 [Aquincola sp.]|nr:hypothetical protein [Aquincola sp.]